MPKELTSIYSDVNQPQRCPFTVCFANKMTLIAEILGAKVHLLSGGTELEKEQNAGGEGGCWRLFSGLVSVALWFQMAKTSHK